MTNLKDLLRNYVTGAIERGEATAIEAQDETAPDFEVTDHGSVVLFHPLNANARDWLDENVASEFWQWFGGALAVEPRYAPDLASGIEQAGFVFTEDQYRV